MLYERWRQIARDYPREIALYDAVSTRTWSFSELLREGEQTPAQDPVIFPNGMGPEFVFAVLRAWRSNRVVCPLEPNQPSPECLNALPPGTVHLKTTSASTSSPRLIAFTASQLLADAENIVRTMGLRRDWPNVSVISLAHSYGFSNLVLPLLLHGVPLILAGASLPESLRRAAALRLDVTLASVPALWGAWLHARAIPSNVRLAISAGAPLAVALERKVFDLCGLKIHNFYGSSECGGIAYDSSEEPREDETFVGTSVANVRLSVADDGCLEVHSAAVGQTYWPVPHANLANGCFHTGDLADNQDGRIFLRGRVTDQINVAGRKVLPEIIEKAVAAHPDVRGCLAFGVPSPDVHRGETIVACVEGDSGVTSEALRNFVVNKLADWQMPKDWWLVPGLQVNGRGKLSRAEWRQKYLERNGDSARSSNR